MKPIVFPALVVLSVLAFFPNRTSSAREMDQKPQVTWDDLAHGVKVLRVWQLGPPDTWPQEALMEMPNDVYRQYSQDPQGFMGFVNNSKVFSKDIILAGPWVTLSSFDGKGVSSDWIITMVHGKRSWMVVSALPKLMQDPGPDPRK